MFQVCQANVERRAIQVSLNSPVRDLIVDASGAIVGMWAEVDGRSVAIRARRATVLASGDFEHNERMKLFL